MYAMGQREIDAVAQVVRSGQLFRYRGGEGGWCDRFEAALAKKIGVKQALTTSSGTSALMCVVWAVKYHKRGKEAEANRLVARACEKVGEGGIPYSRENVMRLLARLRARADTDARLVDNLMESVKP